MTTVTRRGASKWVRKSSQWRCGWMGLAEKRVRDLHKGGKTWAAQRQKWPGLVETGVQSKRPHEQVYGMQWGTWLDRQNYRSLGWMLSIWEGLLTLCGVSHRHGLDHELLWLWCRLAAIAPIWPLAWELLYAMVVVLESKGRKAYTLYT